MGSGSSTRSLATRLGCTHPTVLSRLLSSATGKCCWIPHVLTDSRGLPFVCLFVCLLHSQQKGASRRHDESWALCGSDTYRAVWGDACQYRRDPPAQAKVTCTPRSVSFVSSGIRKECCNASCFRKDTHSPAAFTPIILRNWRTLLEKNGRDLLLSTFFTTSLVRM